MKLIGPLAEMLVLLIIIFIIHNNQRKWAHILRSFCGALIAINIAFLLPITGDGERAFLMLQVIYHLPELSLYTNIIIVLTAFTCLIIYHLQLGMIFYHFFSWIEQILWRIIRQRKQVIKSMTG